MLVVRLVKTPGARRPIARCKEGLADIRIVEAVPRASASGQAVKLAPRARERRPDLEQEMQRPPVDPPEPIHAPAPSIR